MNSDPIAYNFPATRFARENSPGDQLAHILSEMREIREAVTGNHGELEKACRDPHVLEELADLGGSLETFWRILAEQRGPEFVERTFLRVKEKNFRRGYYWGQASSAPDIDSIVRG